MKTPERWSALEHSLREHADDDAQWWPFLSMRPQQDERLTEVRCLGLACLYALPITLLTAIISAYGGNSIASGALLTLCTITCSATYLALRLTLLSVWNRRAEQLAASNERRRRS